MSGSYCRSLYPFSGEQHLQGLCFDAGEIIRVVQALPGGWWEGERDGHRGWFPSSYVQVLEVSPQKLANFAPQPGRAPARVFSPLRIRAALTHRCGASHMNVSPHVSFFCKHSSRILWFAWLHRTGCSPRPPPLLPDISLAPLRPAANQTSSPHTHTLNSTAQSAPTGLTQVVLECFCCLRQQSHSHLKKPLGFVS